MSNKKEFSRRTFIKATGMTAASLPVFTARSYGRVVGANERLRTAIIGCGTIGGSHLRALLGLRDSDNVEILNVCDVWETRARGFLDDIWRVGGHATFEKDYRRVLENKDLDYITICTPEHWHARQTVDALDAGFHVYCEKPITHGVEGAHRVLGKVRETGLKMQVGVQGMSDDSYATAGEAILAGKLGPVVEAQTDYVRNYPSDRGPWRTGVDPNLSKPADLDWDSWLGPAPSVPWSPNRYFEWRCYRAYSGGISTDLFIHRLTRILKACRLDYPVRVTGMGGIYLWADGRDLPDNFEMIVEYPAVEGVTPGMTVHVLGTMANANRNRHLIRGKDATLIFTPEGWEIVDEESDEVVDRHEKKGAEDIALHHSNLHSAIRSGAALNCPVELGVAGLVAVAGANQSWFEKRMLSWDKDKGAWV